MSAFDLDSYIAHQRDRVEQALEGWLAAPPPEGDPGKLVEAMRYAVLGGGKRLRPILTLASYEACQGPSQGARAQACLRAACAVELVHCYSLVHDDLPAMDDDKMRRGRPTVHLAFDEATAILAGDALLTLAFEWAAEATAVAAITLAREAGFMGMIRGQARDIALGGQTPSLDALEQLHAEKTGALFCAATSIGGLCAGAPADKLEALRQYGLAVGILFQYADDLEDKEHGALAAGIQQRIEYLMQHAVGHAEALAPAATPLTSIALNVGLRAGA